MSRVLVLATALAVSPVSFATEYTGIVSRVFDGDSFIARLAPSGELEIRLGGIDAPEKNQPYADEARSALRGMILDRKIRIVVEDIDKYGRTVARVYRVDDGLDVNAELVRRGHVWVYRRKVVDAALFDLERAARDQKLGLWALPEAEREPPWRWRRTHPSTHQLAQ